MSSRGPARRPTRGSRGTNRLTVIAGVFAVLIVLAMVLGGVMPVLMDFSSRGDQATSLDTPTPGPSEYEQQLRAAVAAAPDDPQLAVSLANLLVATGQWQEAKGLYEQALDIDPDRLETRLDFGTALARQGAQADAEAQLKRALEIDPTSADGHLLLGELYLYWQPARPQEAATEFAGAITAQPDSVAAVRAREYLSQLGLGTPVATPVASPSA